MAIVKSVCVYCGSASGILPVYADAARKLAKAMVENGIALVYGGGNVGLMGVIADEVMRLGGEATGVIPHALADLEVGHHGLTRLHLVDTMHERKAMMAELSDGFIAMPGGFGTLEELFEALTWSQLGLHGKPVGLLNTNGFYDGLLTFLRHQSEQGFLKEMHASLLLHEPEPLALLESLRAWRPELHPGKLAQPVADRILP